MGQTFIQSIEVYNEEGELVAKFSKNKDAAKAYGVTPPTMLARVRKGNYYKGFLFKCGELPCGGKPATRSGVSIPKDFEEKHTLITYEAKGRICLSPCPFKEAPKPKIASALCQGCNAFCGINRETHQVACNLSKK